ncbi:MAG: ribosome biogenesis GTPase YlqF [Oceanospirillaceae bacterium]
MHINWFPGHMNKARIEIEEAMNDIDMVIEVLDARLPMSSQNPMIKDLRQGTPVLKLLNKQDLADPEFTQQWVDYFNEQENIQAISIDISDKKLIAKIPDIARKMAPIRIRNDRPVRVMIMGIPNVGKSTMINALVGKRIAKVGNEPAVTKTQTRYTLKNGIILSDTPGILWPKIADVDSGYRLATSGAIRDTALEYESVALYAASFMMKKYPQRMLERYKLQEMPATDKKMLEVIGSKRGGLRAGGKIDMHKAAEVMIHDIRGGKLGLITYETVAEWYVKFEEAKQRIVDAQIELEKEQAKQALIDEERAQRDAQRQAYKRQNAIDDARRERAENEEKAQLAQHSQPIETQDRGDT